MVSCRAPGCTNRTDKNSNIIALVTIIIITIMIIIIIITIMIITNI